MSYNALSTNCRYERALESQSLATYDEKYQYRQNKRCEYATCILNRPQLLVVNILSINEPPKVLYTWELYVVIINFQRVQDLVFLGVINSKHSELSN